jgi:hypothetical protein
MLCSPCCHIVQAGLAEGCCQEAARLLGNCTAASDGDASWKGLLQEEAKQIEALRWVVCMRRSGVWFGWRVVVEGCNPSSVTRPGSSRQKVCNQYISASDRPCS